MYILETSIIFIEFALVNSAGAQSFLCQRNHGQQMASKSNQITSNPSPLTFRSFNNELNKPKSTVFSAIHRKSFFLFTCCFFVFYYYFLQFVLIFQAFFHPDWNWFSLSFFCFLFVFCIFSFVFLYCLATQFIIQLWRMIVFQTSRNSH